MTRKFVNWLASLAWVVLAAERMARPLAAGLCLSSSSEIIFSLLDRQCWVGGQTGVACRSFQFEVLPVAVVPEEEALCFRGQKGGRCPVKAPPVLAF